VDNTEPEDEDGVSSILQGLSLAAVSIDVVAWVGSRRGVGIHVINSCGRVKTTRLIRVARNLLTVLILLYAGVFPGFRRHQASTSGARGLQPGIRPCV